MIIMMMMMIMVLMQVISYQEYIKLYIVITETNISIIFENNAQAIYLQL